MYVQVDVFRTLCKMISFSNQNLKQRVFGITGFHGKFDNPWNGFCSFHACHRMFHVLLRYSNGFQGCCSRSPSPSVTQTLLLRVQDDGSTALQEAGLKY